ncbi:PAS domain S-box protein [Bradyrhizobium japonicum]|uniref:PAS domain S-box protein n=1 Tax=Bradyrhizobium japonicum TaxID=375 RepID=UPI0004569450|nr:PAS domain S-box protein [Bradyrhizobium japonicum]AHY49869.1 Nodulation protein V [Bradyrhizobium japonicum SEMIA 5079]MCD9109705.1 PAS domain S-box protein [Bradyrhizobium japonicum]MCD9253762.1 PAS domain S-box protein [Bradyrhizobium japonicum SEMIA 5079]MCD9821008.1 PAS domain S-box protein [Bradyrhizobium japonicum]MCD9894545.1 PAS domain S-box protein [Bradyrhizobium japonicum]
MRYCITTADTLNDPLPDTTAAERLRRHLEEIARERDNAYHALQEREAELARIQRIGKVGGLEVDFREGFKNRRSPEYLMLHGLPADAVDESHEDWVNRIHPEDRDAAVKHFLDSLAGTNEDYTAEYRIIRPNDGETRWIRVVAKFERDSDGRAIRLVGAHIDITAQALARETLRESEERFRLIANSAPVPIWVTKLDRTRSFANQAYVDFVGLPYDQAIAFDWRKVLHPDDLPHVLQQSVQGEASLKPFVLEARYRDASGEWRWLRSESQPRWDPTGKHIGFIGVAHDITVAKQAEIELRQLNETLEERIVERTAQLESNEARLRAILETSNQYQGLVNLDGELLYANKTALDGIGASAADVIGKPFWDTPWFTGTHGMSATVRKAFDTVLRGEAVRLEMRLRLPIGERDFDFGMRPVLDRHGNITGAVPEAVDITERRRGEEALRQSQKMEAIGQLTGGVAHDFNNLLTIIRSATDFLRRRELPEERRRRYVDAISDTVERASKLTAQLLAFARRQSLKPQIFNVGSQVEGVAQLVRPLVGGRIEIAVEVNDADCFTVADVAQFETALINLAINARDAMGGEGRLTIAVRKVAGIPSLRAQSARGGDYVAISVADTGSGIAPENIDAIFEPFFTTKEVGKGTGLGLSQAFGFAKQSEGDIAVTSTRGEGATFTIYLPQAHSPAAEKDAAALTSEAATTGRGYRVLVVEDNDDVGQFSTELLEDLGYVVRRVANANAALGILGENEFAVDLVFSDVIMPGMNGVELAGVIRERYPGLPVVLTSGYSNVLAENAHRGFELIQKPYSVESLSRILRKAITEKLAAAR